MFFCVFRVGDTYVARGCRYPNTVLSMLKADDPTAVSVFCLKLPYGYTRMVVKRFNLLADNDRAVLGRDLSKLRDWVSS